MMKRRIGINGPEVSAIGMGCWAIGGLSLKDGHEQGWSGTDDVQSIAAVHIALDMGVNFLDTADVYGAGHSERLLGQALKGRRDHVILASKFGKVFNEATRERTELTDTRPEAIVAACEASLRRLQTDWIDLYQLHDGKLDVAKVPEVLDTLERLVAAGKIRWYGWSTDSAVRAEVFRGGAHCAAIQHRANLFENAPKLFALTHASGLASICRSPLGQGLLTGKFNASTTFPETDLRAKWRLNEGELASNLAALDQLKQLLCFDGRSLSQGALAWLLAKGDHVVPIPGFKNTAQVKDNAGCLQRSALPPNILNQIDQTLVKVARESATKN